MNYMWGIHTHTTHTRTHHTPTHIVTFYYKLHVLTFFELSGLWHDILQYFAELNTIVS